MPPEFDAIGLPSGPAEPLSREQQTVLDRRWHNYGRDLYAGNPEWLDADTEHLGSASTMELAEHIVHLHNAALRQASLG